MKARQSAMLSDLIIQAVPTGTQDGRHPRKNPSIFPNLRTTTVQQPRRLYRRLNPRCNRSERSDPMVSRRQPGLASSSFRPQSGSHVFVAWAISIGRHIVRCIVARFLIIKSFLIVKRHRARIFSARSSPLSSMSESIKESNSSLRYPESDRTRPASYSSSAKYILVTMKAYFTLWR